MIEADKHVDENDLTNRDEEKSFKEIDNEWYTFVANAKTSEPESEALFHEKDFNSVSETKSKNVSEDDKHSTDDIDTAKINVDDVNDKESDSKTEIAEKNDDSIKD